MMASRWAYEALAVNQFVNNEYQKHFYDMEMLESNVTYDLQFLVPALIQEIRDVNSQPGEQGDQSDLASRLVTIQDGFSSIYLTGAYPGIADFQVDGYATDEGEKAIAWLQSYKSKLSVYREKMTSQKDMFTDSLRNSLGGTNEYVQFKRAYYNDQLADMVLNRADLHKIVNQGGQLIRKMEPVYMYPSLNNGRAHFYASVKKVGKINISTFLFNNLAIWLMTIILYFTLRYSILRRSIDFFGDLRRKG
jgi:hypothetical protein